MFGGLPGKAHGSWKAGVFKQLFNTETGVLAACLGTVLGFASIRVWEAAFHDPDVHYIVSETNPKYPHGGAEEYRVYSRAKLRQIAQQHDRSLFHSVSRFFGIPVDNIPQLIPMEGNEFRRCI